MRLTLDSFVTDSHNLLIYPHCYHWASPRDRKASLYTCCKKSQIPVGNSYQISCCKSQWSSSSATHTTKQLQEMDWRNGVEPIQLWHGEIHPSALPPLRFFAKIALPWSNTANSALQKQFHSPDNWADIVFVTFPEDVCPVDKAAIKLRAF